MKTPNRRENRLSRSAVAIRPIASFFVLWLMLSCSSTRSMFGGRLPFQVTVDPDANENSAVAVDLVVVYDAKLVDKLLELSASAWFLQKNQLVKDHPRQIDIHKWEWVPGQSVKGKSVTYESGAKKIVLFANYVTEGEHRRVIDPQRPFHLTLGALDLEVVSQ
jgi:type VI secretion system protein